MTTQTLPLLRDHIPSLYAKAIALLRQKAAAGDPGAKAALADIEAVDGSARVRLTGEGELYVSARRGAVTVADTAGEIPVKVALEVPPQAVGLVLGEALKDGALDEAAAAQSVPPIASKRFEDALAGRPLTCHIKVRGVPELGDVPVKLGFNVTEPPETPGFTCEIAYADLEAARDGKTTPQELFLGGKLKMGGDYSLALQLAMQLMQPPAQA